MEPTYKDLYHTISTIEAPQSTLQPPSIGTDTSLSGRPVENPSDNANRVAEIPTEIWRSIFLEYSTADSPIPRKGDTAPPNRPPNLAPLRISAVCSLWRTIAAHYPEIWCSIPIWASGVPLNLGMIRHYQALSRGMKQTIFVHSINHDLSTPEKMEIKEIFRQQRGVDRIICHLTPFGIWDVNSILDQLPPLRELWAWHYRDGNVTPDLMVSPHHCNSAIKAVIHDCRVVWEDSFNLHLEEFTVYACQKPLRRFEESIPGSLRSLRIVETDAIALGWSNVHLQSRPEFSCLRTIKCSLQFFARSLIGWGSFPRLRRFEIISPESPTYFDSKKLSKHEIFNQITEIVCTTEASAAQWLVSHIIQFVMVEVLELQGDAVHVVLDHLIAIHESNKEIPLLSLQVFPALSRLIISAYSGPGDSIISFIQSRKEPNAIIGSWKGPHGTQNGSQSLVPIVELNGCTGMELETRTRLINCTNDEYIL